MRGRDIKRYGYNWANLWLINTHNGVNGKYPPIDINDYPAIKQHLDLYWDKISKRDDKGVTPYNLRNCAYLDDFFKPKIVWGEISDKSKFAFDFYGSFTPEATTFYMKGTDIEYLLCALNSSISEWMFSKVGTTTGVGTVRWKKYTIEQLLVGKPSVPMMNKYIASFEKLKKQQISTEEFEMFCDKFMFELYGLTEEEISFIQKQ